MDKKELALLLDISAVKAEMSIKDVINAAEFACVYGCKSCVTLPYMTPDLGEYLHLHNPAVKLCGVSGFPFGAETTRTKVETARELILGGCSEIDMVMNIGAFKSGRYADVISDVKNVKDACGDAILKVIIETGYLDADEICRASELVVKGNADFVKTSTGFIKPTTVEMIKLIKKTVGNSAQIKAAGGIRSLSVIEEMIAEGASRFGMNAVSAASVFKEL